MNRWYKFSITLLASIAVFAVTSGRAEAARIYNGETHTPSSFRAICNTGSPPVDFAAYPSNVSVNLVTGVVSYDINVKWQRCNSTQTRAYAVYSIGQEVCPVSGTYGAYSAGGGIVTDCVKYIGSPAYSGPGNGLVCATGTNSRCVTTSFVGVRRAENQPSGVSSAIIPMQSVIPNWGSTADTGSWTIANTMCQYYKTGRNYGTNNDNQCIDMSMSVSWKEPIKFPTISCGSAATNPSTIEEGQTFDLSTTFNLGGGTGLSGQTTYNVTLSIPSLGINNQNIAINKLMNWSGTGFGELKNMSIPNAGIYPLSYIVSVSGSSNSPQTCTGAIKVVRIPYVSFYGADVYAGGDFLGNGSCTRSSDITTFTRAGSRGSGVQFAALALGTINGFNSARLRSADPKPPKGLTFANAGSLSGSLGASHCIPDYFADAATLPPDTSTTNINLSSVTTGNKFYKNSSTITISGTLGTSQRTNIFVEGDVRITSDIKYATTSWANTSQIPSLHLYVKGNILIESDVSEIAGMYVAQPSGSNKGEIVTCVTQGTDTSVTNVNLLSICSTKLTINGSFTARKVSFLRASNSLRDAASPGENSANGSKAAEVFNFGPEHYLSVPEPVPGSSNTRPAYDSFTGLPPIL